jgi:hypothetical protein
MSKKIRKCPGTHYDYNDHNDTLSAENLSRTMTFHRNA